MDWYTFFLTTDVCWMVMMMMTMVMLWLRIHFWHYCVCGIADLYMSRERNREREQTKNMLISYFVKEKSGNSTYFQFHCQLQFYLSADCKKNGNGTWFLFKWIFFFFGIWRSNETMCVFNERFPPLNWISKFKLK